MINEKKKKKHLLLKLSNKMQKIIQNMQNKMQINFYSDFLKFSKIFTKFYQSFLNLGISYFYYIRMKVYGGKMKYKKLMLNLKHKHQEKSLIKLTKNYNDVECYLEEDENDSNIKYGIIIFDENNKIIKNDRGKIVKQDEFQQIVLTAIDKINVKIDKMDADFKNFKTFVIEQFAEQKKFNEQQLKFNELFSKRLDSIENFDKQEKFNELFSERLDSIEYRLTRLESFHEKDIKNYESFHQHEKDIKKNK